jgi:hypothetical protein
MIEKAGQKTPAIYSDGETGFEKLCSRDDLDLIYIATPWEWHVPQILAGLNNGKHVGTEVPCGLHHRGLLENRKRVGKDAASLSDHGELLLRLLRDDGFEYGAGRAFWRTGARRVRLQPRSP